MSGCARSPHGCARCDGALDFDFTMAFQPIVDLSLGRIQGYEALVRGVDGESAAETLARVDDVSRYRFDQLCRTRAVRLADKLGLDGQLSINMLPNAIYEPEACLQTTLAVARELGWPHQRICFEITETEFVDDREQLQEIVDTYRHYGFSVAIDDFGSGYANLDMLVDMRPDILKVDRRLISGIDADESRQAILRVTLQMARSMGMILLAEGVETVDEARWLYHAGISRQQGFFYARPQIEALPGAAPYAIDAACGRLTG